MEPTEPVVQALAWTSLLVAVRRSGGDVTPGVEESAASLLALLRGEQPLHWSAVEFSLAVSGLYADVVTAAGHPDAAPSTRDVDAVSGHAVVNVKRSAVAVLRVRLRPVLVRLSSDAVELPVESSPAARAASLEVGAPMRRR